MISMYWQAFCRPQWGALYCDFVFLSRAALCWATYLVYIAIYLFIYFLLCFCFGIPSCNPYWLPFVSEIRGHKSSSSPAGFLPFYFYREFSHTLRDFLFLSIAGTRAVAKKKSTEMILPRVEHGIFVDWHVGVTPVRPATATGAQCVVHNYWAIILCQRCVS